MTMSIGLIGFGAMGQLLYSLVERHAPGVRVAGILSRNAPAISSPALRDSTKWVRSAEELCALQVQLVVECAGHEAVRTCGPTVLTSGADLLVASVGAIADEAVETALRHAAHAGHASLRIPSGALGGLDVLGAARFAGLNSVIYTSRKAVNAWRGTPAEALVDLRNVSEPQIFFEGDARSAALTFPQNANVAAAVALAGAGFEKTQVRLMVDPGVPGNQHSINASGDFGRFDVSVTGNTMPGNSKTSVLAAYSLVRTLANLNASIVVG
jgi:aspartate dehydrogenase